MADYLSETDWKAQLKTNKLLSGTGISEALRTLATERKGGTAKGFGDAVNNLIAVAKKAQKKFMADKTSKAYMDEIVKAANKVMTTEVNVRVAMEVVKGSVDVLEGLVNGAKDAKALQALQQKVRAPAASIGKIPALATSSKVFAEISKDDWFNAIDDNTFAAKKKELLKAISDVNKLLG